ncbi:hypothetical protein DFH94DRAFT_730465 [Russula ochroleuca]|uniref:Uncharacterized protein n=1 Tax=Russula ochroleuca TaxID=152965 RepID=A0A9P5TAY6_9AGAM|nr:hypothetical protein DFH94DRAFT_730465 [Russula ochroleuca]
MRDRGVTLLFFLPTPFLPSLRQPPSSFSPNMRWTEFPSFFTYWPPSSLSVDCHPLTRPKCEPQGLPLVFLAHAPFPCLCQLPPSPLFQA